MKSEQFAAATDNAQCIMHNAQLIFHYEFHELYELLFLKQRITLIKRIKRDYFHYELYEFHEFYVSAKCLKELFRQYNCALCIVHCALNKSVVLKKIIRIIRIIRSEKNNCALCID